MDLRGRVLVCVCVCGGGGLLCTLHNMSSWWGVLEEATCHWKVPMAHSATGGGNCTTNGAFFRWFVCRKGGGGLGELWTIPVQPHLQPVSSIQPVLPVQAAGIRHSPPHPELSHVQRHVLIVRI